MNKLIRSCLCLQVLFWTCATLPAVQPDHWTVSTSEEFLAGDLKGVSLTGEGGIVLAPSLEQVLDTGEAFIHSSVMDAAGNLYLGTGTQGKIFRLGAAGEEGGEWARLGEAGIHALAVDSSNRLYAASSPDGKVYRFDGGPTPQPLFDPDEKYIWSLAVDSRNNLYVGTGPQGNIYKVDPQGHSEVFYKSKESHIVTLKISPDGSLLAGTAPGGLVFRFAADGKPFVLYDSSLDEIKSIVVDRLGNIYAAALEGGSAAAAAAAVTEVPNSPARKGATAGESPETGSEQVTVEVASTAKGKRSEVYRIDKNNVVETIYSSSDGLPYDLLVRADGTVLIGTSNKGRIISIDSSRFVTYLLQTPEEQVTQLQERGGRLYAATSNLGKVFLVGGKSAAAASYESKPFDAGTTSKWGVIRWRSRGATLDGIRVFTRSGNTVNADQTWGAWEGPYPEAGSSQIKSAPARFIQWKIEFPEKAAALTPGQAEGIDLVSVSFLQENLPPQLKSLTVHPPGVALTEFPGASQGGGISPGGPDRSHFLSLPRSVRDLDRPPATVPPRRIYYPGARSLSWIASDANQDAVVYSVWLRKQGETNWLLLKDNLQETNYTIDGASLPSGTYFARVIASDRLSNPPGRALEARITSKAFVLANTSPAIELSPAQVQGQTLTLPFVAKSLASTIHQADYSVDGTNWQMLFPEDGIADTENEQYTLKLERMTPGEHQVLIRVVDSVGNVSTAKTTFSVPGS